MKVYEIFLWGWIILWTGGFALLALIAAKYARKYGPTYFLHIFEELTETEKRRGKNALEFFLLGALFLIIGLIVRG